MNNALWQYRFGETLDIDGKKYYFKPALDEGIELVIEKLAKLVGIKSPHYEYNNGYYLSEDLGSNFKTAKSLKLNSCSLYEIWNFIDRKTNDTAMIMEKIVKIYFFDLLIINCDRHIDNWGFFLDNDGKIIDVGIFDNELSFETYYPSLLISKFDCQDDLKEYSELKPFFTSTEVNIKELEYFLATSSEEYIRLFIDMYELLSVNVIKKTFLEIELSEKRKIKDKDNYIYIYEENYKTIGNLLKKRGLKDEQRVY